MDINFNKTKPNTVFVKIKCDNLYTTLDIKQKLKFVSH